MAFATFALILAGLIVGFFVGLAVGWHAQRSLFEVRVSNGEPSTQVGNEIVTSQAVTR